MKKRSVVLILIMFVMILMCRPAWAASSDIASGAIFGVGDTITNDSNHEVFIQTWLHEDVNNHEMMAWGIGPKKSITIEKIDWKDRHWAISIKGDFKVYYGMEKLEWIYLTTVDGVNADSQVVGIKAVRQENTVFSVEPVVLSYEKEPAPVTGMVYNGQMRELVTGGTTTGGIGTILYTVGNYDKAPADPAVWSSQIPKGHFGKYKVWYKLTYTQGSKTYTTPAKYLYTTIAGAPVEITPKDQILKSGEKIATDVNQVDVKGLLPGDKLTSIKLTVGNGEKINASDAVIKNDSGTEHQAFYEITYHAGDIIPQKESTKPTVTTIGQPKRLKAKSFKNGNVCVTWDKNKAELSKINKIQIQYSTDKTFKKHVVSRYTYKDYIALLLKGLNDDEYYVRIRYIGDGVKSKWSKVIAVE